MKIIRSDSPASDSPASQAGFSRRSFLAAGTAGAAATAAAGMLRAAPNDKPLYKISLAQWSLNRRFFRREQPYLDHLDFAKVAASFGIRGIEYVNQFFKDKANDERYLDAMMTRAADHGVKSLLIMIDGEGNLGEPNKSAREQAVRNHHKWVEAAKYLGCHAIRVNARSDAKLSYDEQMKLAADGLRQLAEYGDKFAIDVIVENHGGLSSNGKWLASVLKMVDHPRCGSLPDFGNFAIDRRRGIWYDRYLGVKELMPFAKAVSAKSHRFDPERPFVSLDGDGRRETDFLRMMRIVLESGYRGWVGIESEGPGNQMEGVRKTLDMLTGVRDALRSEFR